MNGIDTVVILGTGATIGSSYTKKGHSLPGDRGFFGSPQVHDLLPKYCALYVMLQFFCRGYSGDLKDLSLEEVWSFLKFCSPNTVYSSSYDFREEKERWLNQIRSPGSERDDEHYLCRKFRQDRTIPPQWNDIDMSLLGGWDLRCLVSEVYRAAQPSSEVNNYKKLMCKYEIRPDASTVFVSLNYDFVLEHALEQFLPSGWYYPHVQTQVERPAGGVRVLKPHGSLNWLFRGNAPTVEIGTDYRLDSVPNENFEDNRFKQAMVIEPTQVKEALNVRETQAQKTTELFANIWRCMFDALARAEIVFIIGYSFPSTDHHFRTLLRLANQRKQKVYEKVYCCTKTDSQVKHVFAEAERFFPCINKLCRHDEGFEAFVR